MRPPSLLLTRFVLVGLLNTALGLGVIFVASHYFGNYAANLIGYLVVVPVSFLTHRDISFRDRGKRASAFIRYLPTIAVGYFANLFTLKTCLSFAPPFGAQSCAISAHVVVTFLCSRYFVFLHPQDHHA